MVRLNLHPQLLVYLLIAMLLVCLPVRDAYGWYDGEPADLVLGQPNFTSHQLDITQTGMASAADVAVDPTTGKIFVSDPGNFRVLRFANLASLSNDSPAEVVLGQSDFTSNGYSVGSEDTGDKSKWSIKRGQ